MTSGMSNYNQGQGVYSGYVPPAGQPSDVRNAFRLLFQEEFSSGNGPDLRSVLGFLGNQALPARWKDWTPASVGEQTIRRYVQTPQQQFVLLGAQPEDAQESETTVQWCGSVVPGALTPAMIDWTPEDPDDPEGAALAVVSLYAGVGVGPAVVAGVTGSPFDVGQYLAALIVSPTDLNAAGDNPFCSVGLSPRAAGAGLFGVSIFGATYADSQSTPLASWFNSVAGATGVLVRMDFFLEREPVGEGVYEYETEVECSYSLDDGRSWVLCFADELKGGADGVNFPACIGFGAAGMDDEFSNTSKGVGAFDFVRAFQKPLDLDNDDLEFLVFLSDPNGGRAWP